MKRTILMATLALTTAAPAFGAHGRLYIGVPESSEEHASHRADYAFRLGWPWRQERGVLEGTPSIGNYERDVDVANGGLCKFFLRTYAEAGSVTPKVRRGVLETVATALPDRPGLPVAASGRFGKARWYMGPRNRTSVSGVAVLATPRGLLSRRLPVTVVTMTLSRKTERWARGSMYPGRGGYEPLEPTSRQRRTCAEIEVDAARGALKHALASVRVRRLER